MNQYKINMNGTSLVDLSGDGDVDMGDGHSLPPGANYYDDAGEDHWGEDSEGEDETYNVPHPLPKIEWVAYCSARKEVEEYCKIYVGTFEANNPGVRATFEEILMTEMPEIIYNFCDRNPHHATQYKMVFTDYANYIFNNHAKDLQAPTLSIYMERYQLYYYDKNGQGSHYDWFLDNGIIPTGVVEDDAQTMRKIALQKHQRRADDDAMADAFGDMRVHSRLPTVIPRSRTVRDVVGRLAESKAPARSSAPQARRGGGRSRPSRREACL